MKATAALTLAAATALLLLPVADCTAQRGGRWARGPVWRVGYGRNYNVATVDTVAGEITSVERFVRGIGYSSGTHIHVKTGADTITVHIGPTWFLDSRDISFAPGTAIEVVGSRITWDGEPAVMAATLKQDDRVLALRDGWGYPTWSGWRGGRGYRRP